MVVECSVCMRRKIGTRPHSQGVVDPDMRPMRSMIRRSQEHPAQVKRPGSVASEGEKVERPLMIYRVKVWQGRCASGGRGALAGACPRERSSPTEETSEPTEEKQKGRGPINTVAGLTPVDWADSSDAVVEKVAMSHDHSLGLVQDSHLLSWTTWCGGLCM
jgi:hypothetical protein